MAVVDWQNPRKWVVDYFEDSRHLGSGEDVVPPSVQQIVLRLAASASLQAVVSFDLYYSLPSALA